MAGGNLGDLWFDLNIKDSNVRSKLKEISEALSELDLKTESGRKSAEKLFKNFNRENSREIAEDFKNIAAQMGLQTEEASKLSARLKELSDLKADIVRRDKEANEHGSFVQQKQELDAQIQRNKELALLKEDIIARNEKQLAEERELNELAARRAVIAQENAASEIRWNEQKSKAFADALKKQMEADVIAEKNRQVSLFSSGFDTTVIEKRISDLNRMKEIQDKLAYYHPKAQYAFLDYESGLKFGNANTPGMRHKEDELQRLRNIIADLESEFNKLGGNEAFKNVDSQIKSLEQTIARLKESGGSLNLGKMLGLENKSTDEFRIAKEAAMATEAHAKRQNELTAAFEKYFNVQKQVEDAERRLAEATARTNQARREAIAASRQQAESLVRDRVKELEAQRQQLQGLFGSGKNVLSTQELIQLQQAFSQITQELNTLRSAMNNLGSYSIKDLFSIGRGTSEYTPLINSMRTVIDQKQEAINLERKHQEEITRTAAKARNDLAAAFAGANAEAKKMQSIIGDIKSLFLQGGLVFGAQQFFNSIVQTGGEIVQQHVALRSILGDVQKADELFAQTQQLALQSPFKFGELNRDVKQLAAFGVEANDLYDTTKRLADIASGLGVDFGRLGLAFGQVKARSWLDGKELRQFAYAGLPLLQRITELYNSEGKNGKNNYTTADVKKMISGRQVSFEDVQKVLWKMTDEGGQFYNMQFVLSETLLGRWNKLIDAWDIMLGKFAEGKNVVGGTFSFIINRTTDLVLALDKVSNAALAFGAMYALRKGATAIASRVGISSNLAALRAEQQVKLRTFAVEQQQALIEGKITQEKMRQNIADYQGMLNSKINTRNAVEQAALEGRLGALKMQKAFREGLISKEMIEQLRLMGMISAKESELITKEGTRARMSLAVNQAKGKLGGFFSGWNIATLGITIGTALYSAYSQFKDSIKQDTDRINETAKTTVKTLSDTLSEVGNKGTGETLQQQVDKMTDVLKQSGLYTDSIKEQIDSTDDLGKEYDILKQKIIDARNENNFTPSEGESFAKAKKATGAGFAGEANWFGKWTGIGQDDIDENINDVAENLAQLQMKMEKFGGSTKSSMEKVANSILGARAAGMTFEEKIAEICSSRGANGYWETFVKKVSNGNKDVEDDLRGLEDDLDGFSWNFGQIATDDIPKYLEYMAKSRNMDMVEFSRWCKQHPDKFRTMLDQMLSEANKKVPGLVARLQSVAMAILNIGKAKPQEGNAGPKVWKNPNKVGTIERKAFDKLQKAGKLKGGKGGFWQKEMAEYLHNLNGGNSNGWTSFGEAVRKRYKEVRDENDNAKNAGDRQPYVREQRMLEAIAAQSGISLDVGKNKVTGHFGKGKNKNGREEDVELKRLQERIDGFKKARQTYQKYKDVMSEQQAKDLVYSLYPNVKGLDLNDYLGSIAKITPSDAWFNKSTERKKFQTSLNREKADWRFSDELKPEFDRIAADFTEALNKGASQFDLYKSLLEKTGNKPFANLAFKDGAIWDDQSRSLAQQFKEITGFDVDIDASDATAKHYLSDLTKNGQNAYELWKKIVDLIHGNYTQSLKDAADIIEKTEDYEDKILKIRERYNELISKTNDPGIKARYEIQRDKEIGQVKLDKFKNSSDYLNFYGAIVSLGMDKAQAIGARIRQNINEALQSGAIDAREYAKEIKQLDEQLSKLEKLRPSFLNGGLEGIVNAKKERANDMITLGSSQYNKAKEDLNKAKMNGDLEGMAAAASSKAAGEKMMEGGGKLLKGASKMGSTISTIDTIIHGINDIVQGMNDTFQDIKSTASALGIDTESDGWTDANSFFEGFSSSSASATKAWESLKSGNVGGVVSGVVGSFTGWIKAFAKAHDAKLDRQIKLAERQLNELKNLSSNINSVIEKTLGGIYSYDRSSDTANKLKDVKDDYRKWDAFSKTDIGQAFFGGKNRSHYSKETYDAVMDTESNPSAYADQLALLHAQEDELRKQRQAEEDKKKTDKDKIADYDQQIKEMQLQIKTFAQDFLKDVYSIDMKSWASQLTDTVVSAWTKGEDAVEAYKNKVKEMVRDVTKDIVSQKIMEKALEKPLEWLTGILDEKGKLDETDMDDFADKLYQVGENVVPQLTGIFDALKNKGLDLRENGSSSTTNSIKGITEETADLFASYLNAVRLDVSVIREMQGKFLPEMSEIAKSQLTQLNLIARNTLRNADAAERIDRTVSELNDNFNRVINGTKSLKMK